MKIYKNGVEINARVLDYGSKVVTIEVNSTRVSVPRKDFTNLRDYIIKNKITG